MPLSVLALKQWPPDRHLPTEEEIDLARKRLSEESLEACKKGYYGDFGLSFDFTTDTYAIQTWWHLFYPNEKLPWPAMDAT